MTIDDVIEAFSLMDDWADKYRYLIDLGRTLPPFPEDQRTPANKVLGCQSQVWLVALDAPPEEIALGAATAPGGTAASRPAFSLFADSDAHIVRGLVALVLLHARGKSVDELGRLDPRPLFAELGLDQHLSQGRTNGLLAMVGRVKQLAQARRAESAPSP